MLTCAPPSVKARPSSYDTPATQFGAARRVVSQCIENFACMLAKHRPDPLRHAGRDRKFRHNPRQLDRFAIGQSMLLEHSARNVMGVFDDVGDVKYLARWNL